MAGAPPGPALAVGDGREDGQDLITVSVAVPGADTATETAYLPVWPDEALIATAFKDGEVFFGGAVDAAAASVEIEFEGDQVVRVPTLAGEAYTGRNAGRVRFFLGQVTSVDVDDGPRTIRLLDAGGTVIGVAKSPDTERAARGPAASRRRRARAGQSGRDIAARADRAGARAPQRAAVPVRAGPRGR